MFEYGPESSAVATDLERIQFGYTFNDAATLWVGRFHTPYGYWHTAFHHGQQLQTSLSRPRFLEFEDKGGFLPAHSVGLLSSGAARLGAGRMSYDAYLANGNSISDGVLNFNPFKDNNSNKLIGGNVRYAFGGPLDGLSLGLHGFSQQVAEYGADATMLNNTRTFMTGGYAVFEKENWEIISEYYRFKNKDLSGNTGIHRSWAAFAQASYTFQEKWTPYLRFEKTALDSTDSYFSAQESGRSYRRQAVGLRYDLNEKSAIKVELDRTNETQKDTTALTTNEARVQFSVRF